ncbi:MAG: hypothetical protein H6Q52_2197 [Deltaproteobacteria bacterium]|nr:hypothetical protein [Deltaproteobacteria bacterium]
MIYPQGKIIHQNLSAEYTDVPQLLNTLKANGFSGVIEVEAESRKGAFFIVSGNIINAAIGLESDPPAMVGEPAVHELHSLARQPKGLLHVLELSAAQIEILTGPFSSEVVFKALSTDFIRTDQFIAKLRSEKHTGYIDIFSKAGGWIGTLLFRNGESTGFQMISGSGNIKLYEGDVIPSAFDYAVRNGAVFDVYKNADVADPAPLPPENFHQEMPSPAGLEPEAEAPVDAVPAEAEAPAEEQKLSFTERLAEQLARMQDGPVADNERASDVVEDETSMSHRIGLISDLERVLLKLESFTDHVGSKGDFQRLFRHNCVEKSEEYHFLDPFEGQFEYNSGKINLSDDVRSQDFAIATANCLNVVLANLNKDFLKGAALPPGLKGEIETAFRNYKEVITNSGLRSVVPANMR